MPYSWTFPIIFLSNAFEMKPSIKWTQGVSTLNHKSINFLTYINFSTKAIRQFVRIDNRLNNRSNIDNRLNNSSRIDNRLSNSSRIDNRL
jgi:hypothetical protein